MIVAGTVLKCTDEMNTIIVKGHLYVCVETTSQYSGSVKVDTGGRYFVFPIECFKILITP